MKNNKSNASFIALHQMVSSRQDSKSDLIKRSPGHSPKKSIDAYAMRKPATLRRMRLGSSPRGKEDNQDQSEEIRNIIVKTNDKQLPATTKNANQKNLKAHLKPFRSSRSNIPHAYQQEIVQRVMEKVQRAKSKAVKEALK